MDRTKSRRGWWRRGPLTPRLLCLGLILGVVLAVIYYLSLNWGHQHEAWEISWILFSYAFVGVITSMLGLIVAAIVSFFQFLVPESTSQPGRTLFTGGVAMIGAAAATLALFSNMPLRLSLDLWATAGIVGALVGVTFAALAYWHIEEV